MLDPRGRLIYVGKAKSLRARLLSYFRAGSRDAKASRIIECTRAVLWEYAPNEFGALLRELELIHRWKPPFNVLGQPGRRRGTYICLAKKPAPYLFTATDPPKDALACVGPLPGAAFVIEAVRELNDVFKLRDCPQAQPMRFADQGELFPVVHTAGCLRFELGTCSGPCAALVTRTAYGRQVRRVKAFLDGSDDSIFPSMEKEMNSASKAQAYERAAILRDKLDVLRRLRDRLTWLQQTRREFSLVYQLGDEDGRPLWYLIRQGHVRAVLARPREGASRAAARATLQQVFFPSRAETTTVPPDRLDGVLLVAAWFRKRPEEHARVLRPEQALELCRPTAALMA